MQDREDATGAMTMAYGDVRPRRPAASPRIGCHASVEDRPITVRHASGQRPNLPSAAS